MAIKITYQDLPENSPITQDGEYAITITKSEEVQTSFKHQLVLVCTTDDDKTVVEYVALGNPNVEWKIEQILKATGIITPGDIVKGASVELDPEDLKGRRASVFVKIEEYPSKTLDSNNNPVYKSSAKIKRWSKLRDEQPY